MKRSKANLPGRKGAEKTIWKKPRNLQIQGVEQWAPHLFLLTGLNPQTMKENTKKVLRVRLLRPPAGVSKPLLLQRRPMPLYITSHLELLPMYRHPIEQTVRGPTLVPGAEDRLVAEPEVAATKAVPVVEMKAKVQVRTRVPAKKAGKVAAERMQKQKTIKEQCKVMVVARVHSRHPISPNQKSAQRMIITIITTTILITSATNPQLHNLKPWRRTVKSQEAKGCLTRSGSGLKCVANTKHSSTWNHLSQVIKSQKFSFDQGNLLPLIRCCNSVKLPELLFRRCLHS
mmetsp:Transcript_20115/g.43352  ORF Transcript_20115/g.43352 Transcript_20115/m.43352 type:complete len:287 (-) Transcript_20115:1169-2029(-)